MRRGNGEYARNYQRKLVRRFRRLAWQWFEFGGEGIVNGWEESTDGVDSSPAAHEPRGPVSRGEDDGEKPRPMPLNKRQRRAKKQRELFEVRE
jgi:hypothetical protein